MDIGAVFSTWDDLGILELNDYTLLPVEATGSIHIGRSHVLIGINPDTAAATALFSLDYSASSYIKASVFLLGALSSFTLFTL